MSSKKRRLKRKIAMLVRMDNTAVSMALRGDVDRAMSMWRRVVRALGRAMARKRLYPLFSVAMLKSRIKRGVSP